MLIPAFSFTDVPDALRVMVYSENLPGKVIMSAKATSGRMLEVLRSVMLTGVSPPPQPERTIVRTLALASSGILFIHPPTKEFDRIYLSKDVGHVVERS